MADIIFSELSPSVQELFKFIASAAVGGVIGNRTDTWYTSLFYHQRRRLVEWVNNWHPQIEDLKSLAEDERLKILFSNIILKISNELNEEKLILWPTITDSIIRKSEIGFDKKQYFVSLFNRFEPFTLKYLASLQISDGIVSSEIFPQTREWPMPESVNPIYNLGQLQSATTGLTDFSNENPIKFFLTPLGKEFVDFISNNSKELLQELIKNRY